MKHRVVLPRLGTFDAWRTAARALAAARVPADQVSWSLEGAERGLFDLDDAAPLPRGTGTVTASKAFVTLAQQVSCSRTPGAFNLLYQLLMQVQDQPRCLSNRADPLVNRAQELAKSIRRDRHKMRAFVRFREVTAPGANRRSFVAWFEPDHRIEELNAPFFARRFADMDWAIVTPEVTTTFRLGALEHQAIAATPPDLHDDTEALWRTYYANIFNPARLKVKAMCAEMPKKYWKNLPEAALIPDLIAGAEARVLAMRDAAPSLPDPRAQRILDRLPARPVETDAPLAGVDGCSRCPLGQHATQAVRGCGPAQADLMIVGEQPGDQEDLQGRPFVGPAGQLFDRLAAEAGLDRGRAYVTNAVKHFKFVTRGKRRIHQSPSASEVSHCRWWLTRERAAVQPRLTLALGATAALALTGNGKALTRRRGRLETALDGGPVFLSLHPAAILRAATPQIRAQLEATLRADLAQVATLLRHLEGGLAIPEGLEPSTC